MSQHFLLSPLPRPLSLVKVMRMSDAEARNAFRKIRWSETDGDPVCPECGGCDSYDLKSRQVYKCKACYKQYSLTSGTIFASRKLAVRDILAAIAVFINGAKGYSALQLSRDLSVDYKTAFVMLHKVREAIKLARNEGALFGNVAVDGTYFGGYVKPANHKADRKDRRLAANQTGKRQSVIVARETDGRTLTHVARIEADGVAFVAANVKHGSTVRADEASHWDKLAAYFPIKRINHQEAYSKDGPCTNAAESFFSRIRRAEIGIHHRIAGDYLGSYAAEMAWREDCRREANGTQYAMAVSAISIAPKSDQWCGYWQAATPNAGRGPHRSREF
ncbi:IS1595 family transposase [Mesorhizobium sp. M5C.F.Ca.IN.020.29.1.1]|uniref:IS1595 family transposase n=1 Tax=unclassified Mesorhizobium TaxID=325217 RepID=UPI000FC9E150|nr:MULTISPECIES: IS1595 family transposase [unclassified Mesorhizobium]RUV57567.1 IS1595 family transposase [Mesorhizobium sp. M5C.F.Ca.IN.020.29.1.1]TIM84368.1 MAG: IS1595 family transposase [Mesorhizobium sp.]